MGRVGAQLIARHQLTPRLSVCLRTQAIPPGAQGDAQLRSGQAPSVPVALGEPRVPEKPKPSRSLWCTLARPVVLVGPGMSSRGRTSQACTSVVWAGSMPTAGPALFPIEVAPPSPISTLLRSAGLQRPLLAQFLCLGLQLAKQFFVSCFRSAWFFCSSTPLPSPLKRCSLGSLTTLH